MDISTRNQLEATIIGSALYDEENFDTLVEAGFQETDFNFKTYRDVFSIMMRFFEEKSIRPSVHIVKQEYFAHLYSYEPSVEAAKTNKVKFDGLSNSVEKNSDLYKIHVSKLMEEVTKNKLVLILKDAISLAEDKGSKQAIEKIMDLYMTSFETKQSAEGVNFYQLMSKTVESYNPEVQEDLDVDNASKTGVKFLDEKYLNGGVLPGNICVIAGRPGSGKTTLAKWIAVNNARNGKKPLFVTLEMSREQLAEGYHAYISRIPLGKLLKKETTMEEYATMVANVNKPENRLENYYIEESDSLTVSQFINLIMKYKRKYGVDVVFLDYIQQLRLPNGSTPQTEQDFSLISELVRTVIKKEQVCGYILAQVNRDCEKRPNKRPMASDLRSSGKLEQDASYILTTYRDEYYDKETDIPKTMDITVAKNRFGPMNVIVRVMFEGEYQCITNLEDGDLGSAA